MNMGWWKKLHSPEIFQGSLDKKFYFEGWYNKIVNKDQTEVFAFIPSIALNPDEKKAYIQVYNGVLAKSSAFEFPIKEFKFSEDAYDVWIGKNHFFLGGMELNIDQQGQRIKGKINYSNLTPLPTSWGNPGIMGWLSYIPHLQTNHGIVSMNHQLDGLLEVNGNPIDFSEGIGYLEKDWGSSFPEAWVWMQSNHFQNGPASFIFSIATIPIGRFKPKGFLCNFWYEGQQYRFATYNNTKIVRSDIDAKSIHIILANRKYQIEIAADQPEDKGIYDLKAPLKGKMSGHCLESLQSKIHVQLTNKKTQEVIFSGLGTSAGLELMDSGKFQK